MQQKKNLTAAESLFRTAVQLARETDEVPSKELSDRMGGLASVLIQDGRVEEGKRMLDEALNMDDMLGRVEGMTKKLGSLSEAALKVNDIEGALTYCAMSEKQVARTMMKTSSGQQASGLIETGVALSIMNSNFGKALYKKATNLGGAYLLSPKPGQSKESLGAQLAAVRDLDPGSVPADMRQKSIDTLHDAEFRLTAALAVASHIDLNVGKRAMAALHSVYMSLSEVDSSYTVLADKLAETFEAQFDSKYTSTHSWINQALECMFESCF